jgi:hypothetical protein
VVRLFFLVTMNKSDPTWSLVDTYIWSSLELNVAVISACLPTLRPLFTAVRPRWLSFNTSSSQDPRSAYAIESFKDVHGSRARNSRARNTADFERLSEFDLRSLADDAAPPGKRDIIVTHEVAQEIGAAHSPGSHPEDQVRWGIPQSIPKK